MKTNNRERFRPSFHYTPENNWMNDPNGCIFHSGLYHLYYQYYPYNNLWGPMHWGHAVSKDLVDWEERPIVMEPDESGYIFSGSAIHDSYNKSGLFYNNKGIVYFYTTHLERDNYEPLQQQSMAYSMDGGETLIKYKNNPVIINPGKKDFRDPKVIYHTDTEQWIMVLAAGDRAMLYHSENLIEWSFLSEFKYDFGGQNGIWECPDLIEIKDENGEETWVFLISILCERSNYQQFYLIGNFNGYEFIPDGEYRIADYGFDFYAAQSWAGIKNSPNVWIAWCNNWNYAAKTPDEKWRGVMSLPREIEIRKIGDDSVLVQRPFSELFKRYGKREFFLGGISLDRYRSFKLECSGFTGELEMKISWDSGDFFKLFANDREIKFCREYCGDIFRDSPFSESIIPLMENEKLEDLMIYIDNCIVEVFVNEGVYTMTNLIFPDGIPENIIVKGSTQNYIEY